MAENTSTRRDALGWLGALASGAIGLIVGVPGVRYLIAPLGARPGDGGQGFIPVGRVDAVSEKPVRVDVTATLRDAWTRMDKVRIGAIWLIKGRGAGVRALSTVCPHLGCAIDHDDAQGGFACPCHRSRFDESGRRVSGPSPRDMDELETRVQGEQLLVRYRRYRQGTPSKQSA